MRFLDKIARFWQECTTFEKIYCVAFTVTSIAISIIQDASFISALASITGMWCVLGCQGQFEQLLFWCRLPHPVRHHHVAIRPVHYSGHTRRLLFAHAMGWLLVLETLTAVVPNTPRRHRDA